MTRRRWMRWACAGMVGVFVVLGWMGVKDKAATMDEPLEAGAAYAVTFDHEYRVGAEVPPLTKYWAMGLERRGALKLDYSGPGFEDARAGRVAWAMTRAAYFALGPAGADAFLARARVMMLVLGAAVVVVAGRWGWEMGGPLAGLVAAGLVAFDPNFLGNAPLVKTDVATVLSFVLAGWATWHVGKNGTAGWVVLMALAAGTGPVVKYSGVLLPVAVGALLWGRAVCPGDWRVMGRAWRGWSKAGVALALCLVCAAGVLLVMWAAYRFDGGPGVVPSRPLDGVGKLAMALGRWGVVPRAWAAGFAVQRSFAGEWPAFLMGQFSRTGWWDYFLWAEIFKEPVGILIGFAAAVGAAWVIVRRGGAARARAWDAMALLVPAGLFAVAAMSSNVNAGLRHFLVVNGFAYVAMGVMAAAAVRRWGRSARWVVGALAVVTAVEVVAACPDYIAFFNWPSRAYGPIHLLGDANLDWGQDLKSLVKWQREHPGVRLCAGYFGVTPPEFYGLRYEPLPWMPFYFGPEQAMPAGDGVAAVSATVIQSIYGMGPRQGAYRGLLDVKPLETIGGTIYLYDLATVRRIVQQQRLSGRKDGI